MKTSFARIPVSQVGHGVSSVFYGSPYQEGHGLGSLLGGLFCTIMPFLKSGMRTVGKQAIKTGGDILHDVMEGKLVSNATKDNLVKAGHALTDQVKLKLDKIQTGRGIKAIASTRKRHIVVTPGRKRIRLRVQDIFE